MRSTVRRRIALGVLVMGAALASGCYERSRTPSANVPALGLSYTGGTGYGRIGGYDPVFYGMGVFRPRRHSSGHASGASSHGGGYYRDD